MASWPRFGRFSAKPDVHITVGRLQRPSGRLAASGRPTSRSSESRTIVILPAGAATENSSFCRQWRGFTKIPLPGGTVVHKSSRLRANPSDPIDNEFGRRIKLAPRWRSIRWRRFWRPLPPGWASILSSRASTIEYLASGCILRLVDPIIDRTLVATFPGNRLGSGTAPFAKCAT